MRVTMKDLADRLGVTQGTVSKALHGRPGISDALRAKVMQTAQEMGYRVNYVAQTLSRRTLQIGVMMPDTWCDLYDGITRGIYDEIERLQDYNVQVHLCKLPSNLSWEQMQQELRELVASGVDAILSSVLPLSADEEEQAAQLRRLCRNAAGQELPLLLVVRTMAGTVLPWVATEARLQGQLAAEYMLQLLGPEDPVAIITGRMISLDHRLRVEGFREVWQAAGYRADRLIEAYDEPDTAEKLTHELLREQPDLRGLYVSTGNSVSVCRAVTEEGKAGQVRIIGTDLFPGIMSYMQPGGPVWALVYQDPYRQGRMAMRMLFEALAQGKELPASTRIVPQLLLRSNAQAVWDAENKGY